MQTLPSATLPSATLPSATLPREKEKNRFALAGKRFLARGVAPGAKRIARLHAGLTLAGRSATRLPKSHGHGNFFIRRQLRKVMAIFGKDFENRFGQAQMAAFFQFGKDAALVGFFDRRRLLRLRLISSNSTASSFPIAKRFGYCFFGRRT